MNHQGDRLKLITHLKQRGLLWSYDPHVAPGNVPDDLIIEQALKYGDETDLTMLFRCFDRNRIETVWKARLLPDTRFRKLNTYLARVVFDYDPDRIPVSGGGRLEKLRILASRNTDSP